MSRNKSTSIRSSNAISKSDSATTLTKKSLDLAELRAKVPLRVSPRLQQQCSTLCARVPDLEWSGVLFYSTTGTFGEEGFSVEAHELYLMDIGTSSFTGYDYEPDLIEYIMSNPHLMDMKKGHIHSHNTMGVFFSNTDSDEIKDNSEFHNYYLSLIVNNKNDMIAKIAFRGTRKVDSVAHITFKGDNGEVKTGTHSETREDEVVYVYNCEITKPADIALNQKMDSLILKRTSRSTAPVYNPPGVKANELPFEKEKKFYWEQDEDTQKGIDVKQKRAHVDIRIESFMAKVIAGDFLSEDPLTTVLHKKKKMGTKEVKKLADAIEQRMMNYYIDSFPEDNHLKLFNEVMEECQDTILCYEDVYPVLSEQLWEAFNMQMQ